MTIKSERLAFRLFLLILFCLPLPLASQRPVAWDIFEITVAVLVFLTCYSCRHSQAMGQLKEFKWLLIPLAVFQLWTLLQLLPLPSNVIHLLSPSIKDVFGLDNQNTLSLDPYSTIVQLLKGCTYTLFAVCAILLTNSRRRVKYLMYCLVASGTFQAFYGALEVLLGIKYSWVLGISQGVKADGTFVYHNHLANYLMMSLCIGIGLLISQLHQSRSGSWYTRLLRWLHASMSSKIVLRLCLVIMVVGLVLTRSRMGNSAFFLVTVLGGLIALFFYKDRPRVLTVLIVSLLVIDTFVVGIFFGIDKVTERLENTSLNAETRDEVVEWSIDIIKDFPLTGTGLGSFNSTFPAYSKYNIGYYNYAHNEYIQFAVESGIPALLLLGFPIIIALIKSFQALRTRHSKTLKGAALGSWMAILGMMIHISVDFNLQPPANAATFVVILVLCGLTQSFKSENGLTKSKA